jgi:formylglycine-generating enzyme required for sulfatase activity/serine/threonine protein kinase
MSTTNSRYDRFEKIGQNQYGTLHAAHDFNVRRDVIIMELYPRLKADPGRWEKIWAQIEKLADARLENSVHVLDVAKDQSWIILEKLRGNLAERLKQKAMPFDQVRGVLQQILEALKSLHEHGIWHGDINPSNLLYNHEGFSRLSFSPGLVIGGQILKRETGFKYVAPELLNPSFGEVGPATDLYCLGFSALELLKGSGFDSAFKGVVGGPTETEQAWMRWQSSATELLPATKTLISNCPDEFNDVAAVIDRLAKKKVDERYASAEEALAELKKGPIVRIEVANAPAPRPAKKAIKVEPRVDRQTSIEPVESGSALKPWSRDWINQKLKEPKVLYSVLGGVVGMFFLLMVLSAVGAGPKKRQVTIVSLPAGATVTLDGKEQKGKTPATLKVGVGKIKLQLALEGYEDASPTLEIPADGELKPFQFTLMPAGLVTVDGAPIDSNLGLPKRVILKKFSNPGASLELALVSPGEFRFGAKADQRFPGELEERVARQEVPLYVSVSEISNAQYAVFANEVGESAAGSEWKQSKKDTADRENMPVVAITADQASAFCSWAVPGGRLLSELEWEYIARGVSNRQYPWEDGAPPNAARCNLRFKQTADLSPVKSHEQGATPDGILNLLGNAAEWCSDIYAPGFGETESDPGVGKFHAIRGGSFKDSPTERVRLTMRANVGPRGADDVGIRLVLALRLNTEKKSQSDEHKE